MSGTPEPALMAFCSLVYAVVLVPALTRLTFTFGYSFSKAATSCLSCGAQAHQVSVVGVCSAAASDDALPAPLLAGADEPLAAGAGLELELEHAASAPATARPTAAPAMVLAILERGVVGIVAPLYFFIPVVRRRSKSKSASSVRTVPGCTPPLTPSRSRWQARTASTAAGRGRRR